MEENSPIEDLNENLKAYLSTRYDLAVLKTTDKVSAIGSMTSLAVILGVLITLSLLFLSISLGFFLADWLESYPLGFLTLSGCYFLLFLTVLIFRKSLIINPVRNRLIRSILSEQ
jgi:hypothetical protein